MSGDTDLLDAPVEIAEDSATAAPTMALLDAVRGGSGDPRKAMLAALTGGGDGAPQIDMIMKPVSYTHLTLPTTERV